jgi:superfamily II DNA or RNA helicase
MKTHENPETRELAQAVSFLSFRRKEIVHKAESRVECVVDLVKLIDKNKKIIIFGERIDMANEVYDRLRCLYPEKVGLYHSKISDKIRKTVIRNFECSDIRILVSCKTLDEGLNISDTDVGIVMSSTSTERQRIQRLGRVLRKKDEASEANFYYLYVENTIEETEVFQDVSEKLADNVRVSGIGYSASERAFYDREYDDICSAVLNSASVKSWNEAQIVELKRNFTLGLITCDWFMDESECLARIEAAVGKRERNYCVAMLYMVQQYPLAKI